MSKTISPITRVFGKVLKSTTVIVNPIALDNLLIAFFARPNTFRIFERSTFDCGVLHAVLQLFQAEPFTVDRNTEVAQVDCVLGRVHILGGLGQQYGAVDVVVVRVLLILAGHFGCA